MVDKFKEILNISQKLKDAYYILMEVENNTMTERHTKLKNKAATLIQEIKKFPEEPNQNNRQKAEEILKYAGRRINAKIELGKSIQCKNCNMSLSEMKNSIALVPSKETELTLIQSSIVREVPQTGAGFGAPKAPQRISLSIPKKTTVKDYRAVLSAQMQKISGLSDSDPLKIDLEDH